jgi:hypothetical protein
MSGLVWACLGLSGLVWACLGLSGLVWACLGLSELVLACLGLSRIVWDCPGLSWLVWGPGEERINIGPQNQKIPISVLVIHTFIHSYTELPEMAS